MKRMNCITFCHMWFYRCVRRIKFDLAKNYFNLKSIVNRLFVMDRNKDIIEIDGSLNEGGGQMLRFAVAIGAIVGQSVRVVNIRKGRPKPGLSPQHLKGLELVRDICDGRLDGARSGSTEITFHPGKLKSGDFLADTHTAGSIALLIQVALPCLLYGDGDSLMTLKGGTDADFAPPVDYIKLVFNPIAEKFGINYDLNIIKRGYYPKGGGIVNVAVTPLKTLPIPPIVITERGDLLRISGRSYVAGNVHIGNCHAMAEAATKLLVNAYGDIEIIIERIKDSPKDSIGNASGMILVAETTTGCRLAGTALFSKRLDSSPEGIAKRATDMLVSNLSHGGCVDEFLQDQLILFMALAEGKSQLKCGPITSHTNTVIHLAHLLTKAKFNITEKDNYFLIECDGQGFTKKC